MTNKIVVEIAANSITSAIAAQTGGADRIELCEFLEGGGVTPSYGTIATTRDKLQIPVFVLIRPRIGDFCFSDDEITVMLRDIELCRCLGCDGVVIGALDQQGHVDVKTTKLLLDAAGTLSVTFHRAFDCCVDPENAFDQITALGLNRLLTSGRANTALIGKNKIQALVKQAPESFQILAGGGVNANNVAELVRDSGVKEVHGSAKIDFKSKAHMQTLAGLDSARLETDVDVVRALVAAANS